MNDPREKFGPYWLQTIAPFGLSGLPSPYPALLPTLASAKPPIPPWETPRFSDRAMDPASARNAPTSNDMPPSPNVNGGILGQLSQLDEPPLSRTLTPILPSPSAPTASD